MKQLWKVEYSSNNSGGSWWLTDENWEALEKEGWGVGWWPKEAERARAEAAKTADKSEKKGWLDLAETYERRTKEGYLDCKAKKAFLIVEAGGESEALDLAISNWQDVTGERSSDEGCPCCGAPHYFGAEPVELSKLERAAHIVKQVLRS